MTLPRLPACVLQERLHECGPAALASVMRYFGRDSSLAALRARFALDGRGATMLELVTVARELGLEALGVEAGPEDLAEIPLPAIAHLVAGPTGGHWVVLYRAGRTDAIVADPTTRVERWPLSRFLEAWSGRLVLLAPEDGDG